MKKYLITLCITLAVFLFGGVWLVAMANGGTFALEHVSGDPNVLNGVNIELELSTSKYAQNINIADGTLTHESKPSGYPENAFSEYRFLSEAYMLVSFDPSLPYTFLGEEIRSTEIIEWEDYNNGVKIGDNTGNWKYLNIETNELRVLMDIDGVEHDNSGYSRSVLTDLILPSEEPVDITLTSNMSEEYKASNPEEVEYEEFYAEEAYGVYPGYDGDPSGSVEQEYHNIFGIYVDESMTLNSSLGLSATDETSEFYVAPNINGKCTGTFDILKKTGKGNYVHYEERFVQGYGLDYYSQTPSDAGFTSIVSMDAADLSTPALYALEDRIVLVYSKNGAYTAGIWDDHGNEIAHVPLGKFEGEYFMKWDVLSYDSGNTILNFSAKIDAPFDVPTLEEYEAMTQEDRNNVAEAYYNHQNGSGAPPSSSESTSQTLYCALGIADGTLHSVIAKNDETADEIPGIDYFLRYANGCIYSVDISSYDRVNMDFAHALCVYDTAGNPLYSGRIITDAHEDTRETVFWDGDVMVTDEDRSLSVIEVKGE